MIDRVAQATDELPPSVRTWFEHNRIEATLRIGIASIPETRCPRPANIGDAEFVLKHGMPSFDRVSLAY